MLYMAANFFSCILLIFVIYRTTMGFEPTQAHTIIFRALRIVYCFAWIITVIAIGSMTTAEVWATYG